MEYVRWHVDLPLLASLTKYWGNYPPVAQILAAYFGISDKKSQSTKNGMSFGDFLASVPKTPFNPPGIPVS